MSRHLLTPFIAVLRAAVVCVVLAALGMPDYAGAEDPGGGQQARLAAVLARGQDRQISTERGTIRIISFAANKARHGAIFFIHGDPEWHRIGAFSQSLRDEEAKVLANHLEWLRGVAAAGKFATYFVARTGVFGSEGESLEFRREDSYLSIGHAIDTVIAKDGVGSAAIIGHSGGAAVALYHVIALANPTVRCYALASGVYNIGAMAEFMRIQKEKKADVAAIDRTQLAAMAFTPLPPAMVMKFKYFEPLFRIGEIPPAPERQILIVSNRRDVTAPYFASADLVDRLRSLGHRAALVEAAAKPPTYHYTYDTALDVAGACLTGALKR